MKIDIKKFKEKPNKDNLKYYEQVKECIMQDKVIAIPTETVYGIGTSCFSFDGIEKLYSIKKRERNKPISILVSNIEQIERLCLKLSDEEKRVIHNLMPGPLTLILTKREGVVAPNLSNYPTVGIRMPNKQEILNIIDYLNVPLATTSANISNTETLKSVDEIYNVFGDSIDLYLEGKTGEKNIGSTVARIDVKGVEILRQGEISKEELEKAMLE